MDWYVSLNSEITPSERDLAARYDFIKAMTGVEVSTWERITIKSVQPHTSWYRFKRCHTDDGLNGSFVTAHNYELRSLCSDGLFENDEILVANTCEYIQGTDTIILSIARECNVDIKLLFAKQKMCFLPNHEVRYINELQNVGSFGFATSNSERIMFRNRREGLDKAIESAFYEVTNIL